MQIAQKRAVALMSGLSLPGPRLDIKTVFPGRDSHVGDKTVTRPSYLQHGNHYTGKTTSLY